MDPTQHDYLYSRAELAAVVPEIRRLEKESGQVLVFMNNPWRGQAVINARMLMEELRRITNDELRIDELKSEPGFFNSSFVNRNS